MANISTLTFSQFSDLITRKFEQKRDTLSRDMRDSGFVMKDVIPHGTGDTRRYAEYIDSSKYAGVRGEGDDSIMGLSQYGYEKDLQTYTVSQERNITKHMRDTGKNNAITQFVGDLSEVCPDTIDLDLAHRLTFAWSTSYVRTAGGSSTTIDVTTGDGLALVSAVHTLTGSATTYSNQISANPQFSKGALETAERLFIEETYDNLGLLTHMEADTIVTTRDSTTCNQVRELLHATANVDTSNSGTFNVYKDAYKHVMVSRIATTPAGAPDTSKRKYWFLVSSRNSSFYFTVLNEPYLKMPSKGNNGEDFSTEDRRYQATADYGIAIVAARWIKGSKGDGSL